MSCSDRLPWIAGFVEIFSGQRSVELRMGDIQNGGCKADTLNTQESHRNTDI